MMAERGDLGMKAKLDGLNFAQSEEVLFAGKAAPAENRLLSVEQILQVPQDLLHLLLGDIQKISTSSSPSNICLKRAKV